MWLYVPETSSPSAQELEDLTLGSNLPSHTLKRLEEVWFTWRGKRRQPRLWSRAWRQGGWLRRLSGLTCEPSTLSLGVEKFISSLPAIPARTTRLRGKGLDRQGQGSSPLKSSALPRAAGLKLSSGKTSRGIATDSLKPSSRHWKGWTTALRQEYSRRPKPEIPCGASDCSSWPSVRTSDTNGPGEHGHGGMDLRTVLSNWHAPRANDAEKRGEIASDPRNGLVGQGEHWMAPNVPNGGRSTDHAEMISGTMYHEGKKVQMGLESQVRQWAAPTVNNHKGSSEGSIVRADGKVRDDSLHYQAEQFFRPPSSPDRPIAGGSMSSIAGPNSNQPSAKRKLNPIFVEALMRWPTGLSGFERQETAWTRWWLLMPTYLSALCSHKEPNQTSMFD